MSHCKKKTIYCLLFSTGRMYIGKTENLESRIYQHINASHSELIKKEVNKSEGFYALILAEGCGEPWATILEHRYIELTWDYNLNVRNCSPKTRIKRERRNIQKPFRFNKDEFRIATWLREMTIRAWMKNDVQTKFT